MTMESKSSMPSVHVIIGDANMRKSSLLRCLTGFGGNPRKRDMDVTLPKMGGTMVVHCKQLAALQELNCQTPAQFIAYINALKPTPTDIAVILRVRGTARGNVTTPSALTYIHEFVRARWHVANVALLGPSACALRGLPAGATVVPVNLSPSMPTNEIAHQVRSMWGWL
jgi:hypothetical protein